MYKNEYSVSIIFDHTPYAEKRCDKESWIIERKIW